MTYVFGFLLLQAQKKAMSSDSFQSERSLQSVNSSDVDLEEVRFNLQLQPFTLF